MSNFYLSAYPDLDILKYAKLKTAVVAVKFMDKFKNKNIL